MDRRKFLGTVSAGVILPTILPTGTLFSKTSERKAKHVVYCLISGAIRNFESIDKVEGNLMPYLLEGDEKINPNIVEGIDQLLPLPQGHIPLEKQGTFYKKFRYNSTNTIHYVGHAVAVTGNYKANFQIMKHLPVPSVFELFRKHSDPNRSALNTWWITDQAGPFPFLNYSDHPDYGPLYGANMLHPLALYNTRFDDIDFFGNDTMKQIAQLKKMLGYDESAYSKNVQSGIINSDEDRYKIEKFIKRMGRDIFSNPSYDFWGLGERKNNDIVNIYTACEILKNFKPELMVVNMQNTDIGHSNFTQMCNNLHKADFALAHLWKTIQSIPEMKDNTVLIATPEFGRNETYNTVIDRYGRYAVDHTGEENSKKIFCLVLGPRNLIKSNNIIEEEKGESIDVVPTIADLLGFRSKVPEKILKGKVLRDAYV